MTAIVLHRIDLLSLTLSYFVINFKSSQK